MTADIEAFHELSLAKASIETVGMFFDDFCTIIRLFSFSNYLDKVTKIWVALSKLHGW